MINEKTNQNQLEFKSNKKNVHHFIVGMIFIRHTVNLQVERVCRIVMIIDQHPEELRIRFVARNGEAERKFIIRNKMYNEKTWASSEYVLLPVMES